MKKSRKYTLTIKGHSDETLSCCSVLLHNEIERVQRLIKSNRNIKSCELLDDRGTTIIVYGDYVIKQKKYRTYIINRFKAVIKKSRKQRFNSL